MTKLISCIILLMLLFSACSSATSNVSTTDTTNNTVTSDSNQSTEQFDSIVKEIAPLKIGEDGAYSIALSDQSESGIFRSTPPTYSSQYEWVESEHDDIVPLLKVGNKEFHNVKHTQKRTQAIGEEWNTFTNADGTILIVKDKNSESFSLLRTGDSPLQPFKNGEISETALLTASKEYICSNIDNLDLDEYQYSFATGVSTITPTSLTRQCIDGIYIPTSDEEEINYYNIEFVKYVNGAATADCVKVGFDPSGNIYALAYSEYDVDWSTCEVDPDLIEQTVSNYLDAYISPSYHLDSSEIMQMSLICLDGEVKISVDVDMVLSDDQGEIGAICELILG